MAGRVAILAVVVMATGACGYRTRSYELTSLFPHAGDEWTGADCASSFVVQSADPYAVFLFGDTLVGPVNALTPQRLTPSTMPHSSIATASLNAPRAELRYVVRRDAGTGQTTSLFEPPAAWAYPGEYWWTMQGISASRDLSAALGRAPVLVAAGRVVNTPEGMGFTVNGTALIRVNDASNRDATQWQWEAAPMHVSSACLTWTSAMFDADSAGRMFPPAVVSADVHVYLLGQVGCDGADRSAVLARIAEKDLFVADSLQQAVHDRMQYLCGSHDAPRWLTEGEMLAAAALEEVGSTHIAEGGAGPSPGHRPSQTAGKSPTPVTADLPSNAAEGHVHVAQAAVTQLLKLFDGAQPESSLVWAEGMSRAVYPSIDFLSSEVRLRVSTAPLNASTWSPPGPPVAIVPAPWYPSSTFFAYAPKLHPWLDCDALGPPAPFPVPANSTRLVLSYNVNAVTLRGLFEPGRASYDAYVPMFVCVVVECD